MHWIWVVESVALAIHEAQLAEHGGMPGLRDEGLFLSALARPQNAAAYGDRPDVSDLAAAYAFGLARNHPFIDGNKRTAYALIRAILYTYGCDILAHTEEKYQITMAASEGKIHFDEIKTWIEEHLVKINP